MIAILCALLFVLVHGCAGCDTVKYCGFLSLYKINECSNLSETLKYLDEGMKVIESDPLLVSVVSHD